MLMFSSSCFIYAPLAYIHQDEKETAHTRCYYRQHTFTANRHCGYSPWNQKTEETGEHAAGKSFPCDSYHISKDDISFTKQNKTSMS